MQESSFITQHFIKDHKKNLENAFHILHNKEYPEAKKYKAILKRCKTSTDTILNGSFAWFVGLLKQTEFLSESDHIRIAKSPKSCEIIARIAILFSHCKENSSTDIGKRFSSSKESGSTPLVSEARFRKFISTTESEDILRSLIRLLASVDGSVNVVQLAQIAATWDSDDDMKREIAYQYYSQLS